MFRRIWLGVVFAVVFVAQAGEASAQVGFVVPIVYGMEKQTTGSTLLTMAGVHLPFGRGQRVSVGPSFFVGGFWDKSDPTRPNDRHFHLTWMPAAQVNVRFGETWGGAVGAGYGFFKKDAKTHLTNYKTIYAGLTFGI